MYSDKRVYFLSDLHLGAKYFSDARAVEKRVVAFLDSIKHDASEIYLLGDILDYWFEYKNVIPRGYVRFFGKIAELSDCGIKITWLIGNHDIWIFDYLPSELGINIIDGSLETDILGKKFYLSHGDNIGERPLGFRLIRSIFRNKVCQKLYSSIHPRWTVPIATGWSNSSRKKSYLTPPYKGVECEPLMKFAREHASNNPEIDYYVFGHRHLLITERVSNKAEVVILGDWINIYSYAYYDGNKLKTDIYKDLNML